MIIIINFMSRMEGSLTETLIQVEKEKKLMNKVSKDD